MDLLKYKNDGWGLSEKAFSHLFDILNNMSFPINVIDFGSGHSTEFLYDYKKLYNKEMNIDSFDDSKEYMYPKATLVPLVECSNKDFDKMISRKKLSPNLLKLKNTPVTTRQKNCFYDLSNIRLKNYDLVLLDGPNGNGRSIAFLHLIGKLNKGAIVLIDDTQASDGNYNYDFCDIFNSIFCAEELVSHEFENKDSFKIYRVNDIVKNKKTIINQINRTILYYKYRIKRLNLF